MRLMVILAAGTALAGCGQKGALYLPAKNATVVTPQPVATPAPPAAAEPSAPGQPLPPK